MPRTLAIGLVDEQGHFEPDEVGVLGGLVEVETDLPKGEVLDALREAQTHAYLGDAGAEMRLDCEDLEAHDLLDLCPADPERAEELGIRAIRTEAGRHDGPFDLEMDFFEVVMRHSDAIW